VEVRRTAAHLLPRLRADGRDARVSR
jgi:hypothetical protein